MCGIQQNIIKYTRDWGFKNAVENSFIIHFGWSVMEISHLIKYKKPFNEKNDVRNVSVSHLIRQTQIILINKSQIQCTWTTAAYMSKPYQFLQELWMMVEKLLNGPRTTSSRRTRLQMNSTDKWAREMRTTPTGDVQKTWRWQDLPTRSTRRDQVNLHHVLSFLRLNLSYPQQNQQPVQNVPVILSSDTFTSKTIHRRCYSTLFIFNVFILKHYIY
jgi:hypothetical protein